MRLHRRHAALLRKIRRLLDMRNPRRPRLPRHKPNRQRPLIKIPHLFARPAHHNRRRLNPVLRQAPSVKLSASPAGNSSQYTWHVGNPKLMHLRQRRIRIIPNPNNQSQPQRLLPLIPKRFLHAVRRTNLWTKRLVNILETFHRSSSPHAPPKPRRQRHSRTLQKSPAIFVSSFYFSRFHQHSPRHLLNRRPVICKYHCSRPRFKLNNSPAAFCDNSRTHAGPAPCFNRATVSAKSALLRKRKQNVIPVRPR